MEIASYKSLPDFQTAFWIAAPVSQRPQTLAHNHSLYLELRVNSWKTQTVSTVGAFSSSQSYSCLRTYTGQLLLRFENLEWNELIKVKLSPWEAFSSLLVTKPSLWALGPPTDHRLNLSLRDCVIAQMLEQWTAKSHSHDEIESRFSLDFISSSSLQ